MPINIPEDLPAKATLENENIFVMTEQRACSQDIRPLEIAIVNLMPTKIVTESQLLRMLSNTPLQVNITLIRAEEHESKNTAREHLDRFYTTFSKLGNRKFDGMIITGAPVEQLEFTEVDYWNELCAIMDYSVHNVFSTMYICWGAQAGLYHHYGVPKYILPAKCFGVFKHTSPFPTDALLRGFDDEVAIPHSRHTEVLAKDIAKVPELKILLESEEAGVCAVLAPKNRQIFVTGHLEYDADTLATEYFRDVKKGLPIHVPHNYFKDNNPDNPPVVTWRSHAQLFFSNWLNHYVYQETPFLLERIDEVKTKEDV